MDLFDEFNNDTNMSKQVNIEIWVDQNGRKKNTYISGWEISDDELKTHLKIIKKKNGCNGTIKTLTNNLEAIQVMQFQGDQSDFVKKYISEQGIDIKNIRIKG
jgi:translation initiation factor 1 (eIF-1/SUI1)